MFRKLKIKTLAIVFIGLLSLTVLVNVMDHTKGVNTLKDKLFAINDDQITSVIVQPKMLQGKQIELKKDNDNWKVLFEGKSYNGDANTINGLINQLNGLKPLRLAALSKERWSGFEVTDSLATQVELMGTSGELAKLYIGKFSYQQPKQNAMMQQNPYMQQRGTMTTYVRTGKDEDVFAVEGFLASSANRNADAFRDKTITKVDKNSIQKITFEFPADSSFTMVHNEDQWMADGTVLDSTSVARYLSSLQSLKGSSFTDVKPSDYAYKVKIQSDKGDAIEISAKLDGDNVLLTSSQNSGSVFNENKDRTFKKLFISKRSLEI